MARKPDTECAGNCGKLLWGSPSSLPPGKRMCHECRRARQSSTAGPGVRERRCKTCHELKPIEEFYRTGGAKKPSVRRRECKACFGVRLRSSEAYRLSRLNRDQSSRKSPRDCETCGREFLSERGRFCSYACRDFLTHQDARSKRMLVPFDGEPTVCTLPTRHPARQASAPRKPQVFVEGPCAWCGDRFLVLRFGSLARYCSSSCAKESSRARRGRFVVPPDVRLEIYERDGWVCQLCSDPVDPDLPTSDVWAATLDHVVPQSWTLVPDHRPENLRLAHRWCNSVRGDESYYTEEVLRHAA